MLAWVDRIYAAPVWLITNLTCRFVPKTHPWHKRWFTLEDWRTRRLSLVKQVDAVMWVTLICVPTILYRIAHLPR